MTGLRERKRAATAAGIEEAALRLFATAGYANTTVDDIASAAEVSRATVFRYYPAKEDILFAGDAADGARLVQIAHSCAEADDLSFEQAVRRTILEFSRSLEESNDRLWLRWDIAINDERMLGRAVVAYARWADELVAVLGDRDDFRQHVIATGAVVALYEAVRRCHRTREDMVPLVQSALDVLGL